MEDLLKVGVITTTHGIRGEVKVYPTTDADRFLDLEYVLLDTGREKRKLEIENVKYFKNLVILKFRGIGTGKRNGASGQSESGTGNVWERSCTRKKGGLAGGVRI